MRKVLIAAFAAMMITGPVGAAGSPLGSAGEGERRAGEGVHGSSASELQGSQLLPRGCGDVVRRVQPGGW